MRWKVRGNQTQTTKSLIPVESYRTQMLNFFIQRVVATRVKCSLLGKPARHSVPGVLLGTGHMGSLCIACTQISDSQKESRSSAETVSFIQSRHREPLLSFRESFTLVQQAICQSSCQTSVKEPLCKQSFLRIAVSGSLLHIYQTFRPVFKTKEKGSLAFWTTLTLTCLMKLSETVAWLHNIGHCQLTKCICSANTFYHCHLIIAFPFFFPTLKVPLPT